ncbi:MAG: SDR family oxidoreductase [Xanthobacteraceae bacterium]
MELGLSDKVAMVTGAGSGIGAAVAARLCAEGARVAVVDINQARAEAQAATLREAGGDALAIGCDVTDEQSVTTMVERTTAHFGAVHILVNNAGFARDMRITKMSVARIGQPEDIADVVAFLASERAGYISGDVLHVTGGRY